MHPPTNAVADLPAAVFRSRTLPWKAIQVYISVLLDAEASAEDVCTASLDRIAKECRISLRTTRLHLNRLAALGLMTINGGDGLRPTRNRITLNPITPEMILALKPQPLPDVCWKNLMSLFPEDQWVKENHPDHLSATPVQQVPRQPE